MSKKAKIQDFIPDDINANKGTQRGSYLLEQSLHSHGAGRSILVDKAGRIIAGNKTAEAAASVGLDDAVVVKTNGNQVVVVQRTDIDLDSAEGRALAIADNRVSEASLDWDVGALLQISKDVDLTDFWFEDELDMLGIKVESQEGENGPLSQFSGESGPGRVPGASFGETWHIGDHRVICGNADKASEIVAAIRGWQDHTGMTATHESGKTFSDICRERGYE